MTAIVLHTTLAVVVVAWTYLVATRVASHTGWLWTGTGALVVVGYLAIVARYVFEGLPVQVHVVVGLVSGTLMTVAGAVCLLLFALVSARAGRPSTRGVRAEGVRGIPTEDEDPVIVHDDEETPAGTGASREAGTTTAPRRALPMDGTEG
ncbi:MAG TPA: hypothetical protein VFK68_04580 [Propionibacteriaceae bacterium]|nr:hypothetical protein [Propionibacteriaceae bacterium]